MLNKKPQLGFGVLGAVMMMTTLSLLCAAIMHAVASGQVTRVNHLVHEQAFYNVQAGVEYALKKIAEGKDPNGEQKNFANGTFSISYNPQSGFSTVSADIPGYFAAAAPHYTLVLPALQAQADCLKVDISNANLNGNATRLQGITLSNVCSQTIDIDAMKVAWTPIGKERMDLIRLQNNNVYNGSAVDSGVMIDVSSNNLSSWPIPAAATHDLSYIRFVSSMLLKNFTLDFVMKDGSSKSVFVQFLANDQAACLQVDTSQLFVSGPNYRDIKGITLKNQCLGFSIQLGKMVVAWAPLSPVRNLHEIRVANKTLWAGAAGSGQVEVLSNAAQSVIAAGQVSQQTRLRFNNDMRGYNLNVTYAMTDGSLQQVSYNLFAADMASCLQVDVANTSWSANKRELHGETWKNNCKQAIVLDAITTQWKPEKPMRQLTQIRANNAALWNGLAGSEESADINNFILPPGTTFSVNRYRFDQNMGGTCLTHDIKMLDGTNASVASFCPSQK